MSSILAHGKSSAEIGVRLSQPLDQVLGSIPGEITCDESTEAMPLREENGLVRAIDRSPMASRNSESGAKTRRDADDATRQRAF